SGDTVEAETDMTVNAYDSYVRYDNIDESIQDIIDEALPGRYITVTTFGQSEGGRDQYYVTLSDSKASVDAFQAMNAIAETAPASLQDKLEKGSMGDYRVPFFLNNVHPDEDPGVDAQLNVLRALATQETVTYNTLTGFKDKSVDISEMFAPTCWAWASPAWAPRSSPGMRRATFRPTPASTMPVGSIPSAATSR
ncbi:MAG: hypothetical protein ACLT5P_02700, partial [Flavonifractor plautii]